LEQVGGKGEAEDWVFLALTARALGDVAEGDYIRRLESIPQPAEPWAAAELSILRRQVRERIGGAAGAGP
jgi:hypothetical protein